MVGICSLNPAKTPQEEDKKSGMNTKLFALKEHVSLEEARFYLSDELQEAISMLDLYRLVMDGNITVSVKFHHLIDGVLGHKNSAGCSESNPSKRSFSLPDGSQLEFDQEVKRIEGLWDLTLFGREASDLYKSLKHVVGDVPSLRASVNAVVLNQGNTFCVLQGHAERIHHIRNVINGYDDSPMHDVYADCRSLDYYTHEFVIKTSELQRFLNLINQSSKPEPVEKELLTKERKTYCSMIYVLLKGLEIDPSARGVVPSIRLLTEQAGKPVSENTIRKVLDDINCLVD